SKPRRLVAEREFLRGRLEVARSENEGERAFAVALEPKGPPGALLSERCGQDDRLPGKRCESRAPGGARLDFRRSPPVRLSIRRNTPFERLYAHGEQTDAPQ